MMPSSPPREWDRLPLSPTKSEYSIDLAGLENDGSDSEETPLPQQHIDRVLSEEIGGPSDFTLNLEAWMRGNTLKKLQKPAMKDVGVGEGMLTPQKDEDDEKTASHHTPSATPPKESVFDRREGDAAVGDISSEWDPYAEAATPYAPLTNYQQHLLQTTVEDYHSELTPARIASMQLSQKTVRNATIQETSPTKSDPSTPGRPSSETISPVRSPELQRSRPSTSHTQQTSLEQELQSLREKCQKLEMLNASLSKAVEDERRHRAEEATAHDTEMKEAARREKDLVNMKDEAYKHKDDFRREFSEMKERLQTYEKQHSEGRDGIERLKRDYEGEIKRVRDEGDQEAAELNQEIRALEQDLELARKGREDAEDDARALRAELEEYRDEPDAELDRMRRSLGDDDGLRSRVAELEDELRSVMVENEKSKAAKEAAEERTGKVRAELSVLRETHDATARLTSDHRRAVSLAEELQVKLKDLRRQLKEQQARHEKELESLRAAEGRKLTSDRTTDENESELQRSLSELESKQVALNEAILERDTAKDSQEAATSSQQEESDRAALNDAILERDAAQDSLQTTQADLEAAKTELAELKSELSDLRVMSSTVDVRISDAIRKRESYWRQRVEDMEKERKFMVKALMRMWGREEVGFEDPQRYAYMFIEKELAA
jgi:chromosome segregation ATPase